jgi:zinc transport system substrate-binding protein
VAVGHPAFELERARIAPLLAELPNVQVVDMSRGMRLIEGEGEGSERGGHRHAAGDPHVWVAPDTVAVAARNIAAALERIDPAHAGDYRANLRRFESDVAALDREIRLRLAPERGNSFMVYHPTWGYFAREYGLRQVAIEAEGKEPSAARLIELIGEAKRQGVRVIFVQRGFPRKSAQVIADAVGGRLVVADPEDRDWLDNLRRVTVELQEALTRGTRQLATSPPAPLLKERGGIPSAGLLEAPLLQERGWGEVEPARSPHA